MYINNRDAMIINKPIEHKEIKEGGLSRLYSHIKGKNSFAIIGSQDKDTRESREKELDALVKDYSRKGKIHGYNYLKGSYTYENGEQDYENSIILYNVDKDIALDIGKKLNQETILWKDKDFFGYIKVDDGSVDMEFDGGLSFDDETIKYIGASSQLAGKGWHLKRNPKNKSTPFVFETYLVIPALHSGYVSEYLIDSYNSLLESSLSRLKNKNSSFELGFITAFKSDDWIKDEYNLTHGKNPKRKILDINNERNDSLEKNLKALGYDYFMVYGRYENQERKKRYLDELERLKKNGKDTYYVFGVHKDNERDYYTDKETSFAVINRYNNNDFVDNLLNLAKRYNQESILVVPKGGKDAKFYYANGKVENAGDMTLGNDASFKSLVNGRPMVIESIELISGIKVRTMGQYNDYSKAGLKMKLDESLFEDLLEEDESTVIDKYEEDEYEDSIEVQKQNMSELESKIANLETDNKELVLAFRTPIIGLTDVGYDTLHIARRTPDWYHIWFTNKDGQIANDNQFSSYDNTVYWATLASQGESSGEEIEQEKEIEVVKESLKEEKENEEIIFDKDGVKLKREKTDRHEIYYHYYIGDKGFVGSVTATSLAYPDAQVTDIEEMDRRAIDSIKDYAKRYYGIEVDESLEEDLELTTTEDEIEGVEEKQINNDFRNQLIQMINGEWETIQDYNDLVNNLASIEEYKEYIPVIEGIIEDEHHHIGNLQNVLDKFNPDSNKDIEHGDKEAQEILDKEGE